MIALPCPRCFELARALGEARLERDALRAAVRAYLAARERMGDEDIPDGGLDAVWAASKAAEARLLALLPPEAAP